MWQKKNSNSDNKHFLRGIPSKRHLVAFIRDVKNGEKGEVEISISAVKLNE